MLEHVELARNLCATDYRRNGLFGLAERLFERTQLSLHRAAGVSGQHVRQPFGGDVRAVRGGKGIVDVEIGVRGDRLGQIGVVLFFALPEARVLEDADTALAQDANRLHHHRSGDLGDEHHFAAQHVADGFDNHAERLG